MTDVITSTGQLFGDLWHRYDDKLYEESVALFAQRFDANGFDLSWFKGKRCLDAGCGGGRYTIAMGRLSASEAIGVDISDEGIRDCRRRAEGLPNVSFRSASVLDLPFEDESFDFACSNGVLHHTSDPEQGLSEITRVLKPGGKVFLLLYGARGLRWPTIMAVRPPAQALGYEKMNRAMEWLPANKQRTFLDDLFVPLIAFYEWPEVDQMLAKNGYHNVTRWSKGRLDHEASVEIQRAELVQLREVFEKAESPDAVNIVTAAISELDKVVNEYQSGTITRSTLNDVVFGVGHHRVLAIKGS